MDASLVATMIVEGSKAAVSMFNQWSATPADKKERSFIEKHYGTLRRLCSDSCMLLLKRMEDGQNHYVDELLSLLHPDVKALTGEFREKIKSEFEYRLYFLELSGLIARSTRGFYITAAGKAFVDLARERKDYFAVLFR